MQYTEDFKRGIVRALIASGMSRKEFADKAEIGVGTLKRWVAQYKDEEVPKVDRKKYSEEYKKSIVKNMIYDGITCESMARETGISVSIAALLSCTAVWRRRRNAPANSCCSG